MSDLFHGTVYWIRLGAIYGHEKAVLSALLVVAAAALWLPKGPRFVEPDLSPAAASLGRKVFAFFFVAMGAWLGLLKAAQYFTFQNASHADMYLGAIWNTRWGAFLPNSYLGLATHLGDHFEPAAILYWPIAKLTGSPLAVILTHFLVIWSTVGLFAWLIWKHSRRWGLALMMALLLATNTYMITNLAVLFFPATTAIPILLIVLWAWDSGRLGALIASSVALLTVREEAGVILIGLGLATLLWKDRRKSALLLLAIGTTGFFGSLAVVSHFRTEAVHSKWTVIFGSQPGQSLLPVLARQFAGSVFYFRPLWRLILSFGGLPLFFPGLLPALWVANLPHQLSVYPLYKDLELYYSAFVVPLAAWGSYRGLAWLWDRYPGLRKALTSFVLALSGLGLYTSSIMVVQVPFSQARFRATWNLLKKIPPEESALVSRPFMTPLSFRRSLIMYRGTLAGLTDPPDAILLSDWDPYVRDPGALAELRSYLNRNEYVLEAQDQGTLLWRRSGWGKSVDRRS